MNNKKKIIIAVIIFIFLGLVVFSFANPLNDNEKVKDKETSDKETKTEEENKNEEQQSEKSEKQNNKKQEEVKDYYEDALKALKEAEENIDEESVEKASEAVEKVNDDRKEELEERLEEVKESLDVKNLVKTLENKVNAASNLTDMEGARDFREVEQVLEKVSELANESLKDELNSKLEELALLLDDTEAPVVNVEDGAMLTTVVKLNVQDKNEVVILLNDKEVENNSLVVDGVYTLVLTDKAFNKLTVNFMVDTIAPQITLNGEKTLTLEGGVDTYEELYATVTDNMDETNTELAPSYINYSKDGVFVGKVDNVDTTKVGTYKVVYECTDKVGNIGVDSTREDHEYVIRVVTVVDTTAPQITLNGEKTLTLEGGIDTYEELYATVTDNVDETNTELAPSYINYSKDGVFVGKVDNVDTTKVGTYKVVYEYTDAAGNKGVDSTRADHEYVIRVVTVVDTTAPQITLNGESSLTLEGGVDTYEELYATVTDNVDETNIELAPSYINYSKDGVFVGKVDNVDTTKVGTYKVVYEYTDEAGNKGVDSTRADHEYVIRVVTVVDTTAPQITLNGESSLTLEGGVDTYEELYATVTDNIDETNTELAPDHINYSKDGVFVGKVDNVDTTKVGTYKVVYEYTDEAGNKGVDSTRLDHEYVIRTVTVQDTTAPQITLNGDSKILLNTGDVYEELYATVTDNVDETKTDLAPDHINYTKDGVFMGTVDSVDTSNAGEYKVVYECEDAEGNKGVDANKTSHEYVIRTVTVEEAE